MTSSSTPTALPRFLYSTADMIHQAHAFHPFIQKEPGWWWWWWCWARGSGLRSVLPEPCLWLTEVQASGLCTCAPATGNEGLCTPTASRPAMPAWRTGDDCSRGETRSMRKEHTQRTCWCRHKYGEIMNGLVGSSTDLIVLLM